MSGSGSGEVGSAELGSGSGEEGSADLGSGSGESGDAGGSGVVGSGDYGSAENPSPPSAPPPSAPPLPPTAAALAIEAADFAPPAFTIASAPANSGKLLVDAASPLAAVHVPYMIRICVGRPQQEDLVVSGIEALHGNYSTRDSAFPTASDGRFALHLASPTLFAHVPGEALRHVQRQAVLSTTFPIHAGASSHLFDATILGPDAPHLHADGASSSLELQLANITSRGYATLHDPTAGPATIAAATAAVRGWASFGFAPAVISAASVAIRLFGVRKPAHWPARATDAAIVPLSRGGASAQDDAPPVVGAQTTHTHTTRACLRPGLTRCTALSTARACPLLTHGVCPPCVCCRWATLADAAFQRACTL